jgi:hypothetical protein
MSAKGIARVLGTTGISQLLLFKQRLKGLNVLGETKLAGRE